MSQRDFDSIVETYREALRGYVRGNAGEVLKLFSDRDDVTLANPLGPPRRGRTDVEKAGQEAAAAANFSSGSVQFEEVCRFASVDLGYVVPLEHIQAKRAGGDDMVRFSLRVTTIFRREGDVWKVSHRHADAMTTDRSFTTVFET